MEKIRLFHWFVPEIWLIKNLEIWLPENILTHISGKKTPQIWDFCRNTVKFFDKFKKSCFWPIFPSFGAKKDPSEYEPIFLSYNGIRIVHRIASPRMKEQIAFKNKVRMKQLTRPCLVNILHYNWIWLSLTGKLVSAQCLPGYTPEFQIEEEGGINGEDGKFRPR